jgi:pimeloyl-ACP methyl ester carboxylesterase
MVPKIILISGWAHPPEIWKNVEENLGSEYRIKKLDVTALQDPSGRKFTYAPNLAAEINKFQPDKVAGWSMGGIVLLETLIEHQLPEFQPFLISTTPRFTAHKSNQPPGVAPERLRAMIAGFKKSPQAVLKKFYSLAAAPEPSFFELKRIKKIAAKKDELLTGLHYLDSIDLRNKLEKISRPLSLIYGEQDRVVPVEAAAWLQEKIPVSATVTKFQSGHSIPLQIPERLAAEIKNPL